MLTKREVLMRVKTHLETRISKLDEVKMWIDYLVNDISYEKPLLLAGKNPSIVEDVLKDTLRYIQSYGLSGFESFARELTSKYNTKLGNILYPIRVAISGKTVALPLFQSLDVLGADITIKRLSRALKMLEVEDNV